MEKCVSSAGSNCNPGDALRRIFECIASGMLLPGRFIATVTLVMLSDIYLSVLRLACVYQVGL